MPRFPSEEDVSYLFNRSGCAGEGFFQECTTPRFVSCIPRRIGGKSCVAGVNQLVCGCAIGIEDFVDKTAGSWIVDAPRGDVFAFHTDKGE